MAIAGRVLEVVGIALLFFAGYFLLAALLPQEAWDFLRPTYLPVSAFLGVTGGLSLLAGIHYVRKDRQLREFKEETARNSRSLRGTVSDPDGLPVLKASIDIFIKGKPENEQPMTLRTDAEGRFSADLREGQYVLEVGVPEIGECVTEVAISKSGANPELEIRLDSPPAAPPA
jgi:Carboxypeptidase regulatory-like domain